LLLRDDWSGGTSIRNSNLQLDHDMGDYRWESVYYKVMKNDRKEHVAAFSICWRKKQKTMMDDSRHEAWSHVNSQNSPLFLRAAFKGASIQPFDRRWSFLGQLVGTAYQHLTEFCGTALAYTERTINITHSEDKDEHCIVNGQTVGGDFLTMMIWHGIIDSSSL